jgi:hypothetical protein
MDILRREWSGFLRARNWTPWEKYSEEAIEVFDQGEDFFGAALFDQGDYSGALDAADYDRAIADFTKTIGMDDKTPIHYGKREFRSGFQRVRSCSTEKTMSDEK